MKERKKRRGGKKNKKQKKRSGRRGEGVWFGVERWEQMPLRVDVGGLPWSVETHCALSAPTTCC